MNITTWSLSHDQDGYHAQNIQNNSCSEPENPIGLGKLGLKIYKVSINDDPGMTLTYFKTISNFVKINHCAGTSPRYLVTSGYQTYCNL